MEGILREKLELTDADWKRAKRKYGMIKLTDFAETTTGKGSNDKLKIGIDNGQNKG